MYRQAQCGWLGRIVQIPIDCLDLENEVSCWEIFVFHAARARRAPILVVALQPVAKNQFPRPCFEADAVKLENDKQAGGQSRSLLPR